MNLVTIAPTIGKLIPRLSSNHDGEVLATVRAIDRVLRAAGHDWHDLVDSINVPTTPAANTDWRARARWCAQHRARLTDRDAAFVTSLSTWPRPPSDAQLKWLADIESKLGECQR